MQTTFSSLFLSLLFPPPLPPFLPPLPPSLSLQVESKQLVHGRIFDIASQRGRGGTYLRLLVNFNEDTISLYKEVGGKHVFSHVFLMTYIDCFFDFLTVNGEHQI